MVRNYLVDLITSSIDDGVVYINDKLLIEIFNPAAVHYSGISSSLAVGKKFDEVMKFIDDNQKSVGDLILETMAGHDSPLYHYSTLVCEENVNLPIVFRFIPVNDEKGKTYGCLLVFRDYQMGQYKTDFLSLVAHQLKTPLGSMRWNLEAVLASNSLRQDKKVEEVVRDVYNCNSRMISLVDDLLNASRIDNKKVINKPELTNISMVIKAALKELTYQIEQKKLTINLVIKCDEEITIDSRHLREVIQNILSNSIKYNREQGKININCEPISQGIKIAIGDTGIGIPDTELPLIFSKSFRAKNAIETQIDGSGLGLYVAKSFVEDWGGKITCESTMGRGTVISFTIPN